MSSHPAMPDTRIYEIEGVQIEYLTYPTLRCRVIEQTMRAAYEQATPTDDNPNARGVKGEVYAFYTAMPVVVSVTLPEPAPAWGVFLKGMIEANDWLEDPVKDFKRMSAFAPEMTVYHAYNGYEDTREKVLAAPEELRSALLPVDEFDETLTPEEIETKKKTLPIGGGSSKKRSSNEHGRRSAAPMPTKR